MSMLEQIQLAYNSYYAKYMRRPNVILLTMVAKFQLEFENSNLGLKVESGSRLFDSEICVVNEEDLEKGLAFKWIRVINK